MSTAEEYSLPGHIRGTSRFCRSSEVGRGGVDASSAPLLHETARVLLVNSRWEDRQRSQRFLRSVSPLA